MRKNQRTILFTAILALLTYFPPAHACISISENENAKVYQCGNLKVVKLYGDPVKRAESYGKLIRSQIIGRDVIDFFKDAAVSAFKDQPWYIRIPGPSILKLASYFHIGQAPEIYHNEVLKLAEASGHYSNTDLRLAFSVPDVGSWSSGMRQPPFKTPALGCTSFVKNFTDQSMILGRNLDYDGIGFWDTHQQVVVSLPKDTNELKHIAIGAEGFHYGSVSGVNEKGIVVWLHQLSTKTKMVWDAQPVLMIGEEILRTAKTLDEAGEMLKKMKPLPRWVFMVASLKEGRAKSFEVGSGEFFEREENLARGIAQTNHLFQKGEIAIESASYSYRLNSILRYQKAMELLDRVNEPDLKKLSAILRYQSDKSGELTTPLDIVKPETIQSFLISKNGLSGKTTLSISNSGAPTSSGEYADFDIEALFKDEKPVTKVRGSPLEISVRNQMVNGSEAIKNFDEKNYRKTIDLIKNQSSAYAHLVVAVSHIKLDEFTQAQAAVNKALSSYSDVTNAAQTREALLFLKIVLNKYLGGAIPTTSFDDLQKSPNLAMRESLEKVIHSDNAAARDFAKKIQVDTFAGDLRY